MLEKKIISSKTSLQARQTHNNYFFQGYQIKTYNTIASPKSVIPNNRLSDYNAVTRFFQELHKGSKLNNPSTIIQLLSDESLFRHKMIKVDSYIKDNYIHDHFISWLSRYSKLNSDLLTEYFNSAQSFETVCKDFIRFCFQQNIKLDAEKTLQAFAYHNQLSDNAVKNEIAKLAPRNHINLLGFGLDDGAYEKTISEYLTQNKIANSVTIYGFDPYATKGSNIIYLNKQQIANSTLPKFDLITARWVLHHVILQERWQDLIRCINHCGSNARVVIVEHGFLKEKYSNEDRKLSDLLNATFDIVANIGLRPQYFTNTLPNIGSDFFIQYLSIRDFEKIKQGLHVSASENLYEVGPNFPNQTIYSMDIRL